MKLKCNGVWGLNDQLWKTLYHGESGEHFKQLMRTTEKSKKPFTFIKQSNLLLCLLKCSVCTSSSGDTVSEMGYLDTRGSMRNARASTMRHIHKISCKVYRLGKQQQVRCDNYVSDWVTNSERLPRSNICFCMYAYTVHSEAHLVLPPMWGQEAA